VLAVKALANMIGGACLAAVLAQGGDHKVASRALWPESVRAVSVGRTEIRARRLPTPLPRLPRAHRHVTSLHATHLVLATHNTPFGVWANLIWVGNLGGLFFLESL